MKASPWGAAGALGEVSLFELTNAAGMRVTLSDLGAAIISWMAPDRHGTLADVVLSHPEAQDYLPSPPYLGATIGRWANRIGNHRYTWQGRTHLLDANEGTVTLHGGREGFHVRKWTARQDGASVVFSLRSADGDCGFPGTVDAEVRYTLAEDGTLTLAFAAEADCPTPLNLTNHAYFNLAGAAGADRPTVLDHRIRIEAARYAKVDAQMITTAIADVAGTPFDFRQGARIGDRVDASDPQIALAGGIDHCFVLDQAGPGLVRLAATVTEPSSGRVLSVHTDADGVQFYTGNRLAGARRRPEGNYRKFDGLCLEPGAIPDALNFEDPARFMVGPGSPYRRIIRYRIGLDET